MNHLVLSARLVERSALRYTPAGLPALDLSLEHESTVTEDGHPRRVAMAMRAVGIGAVSQILNAVALGVDASFAGFLAPSRNGRDLVFHVTSVEALPSEPPSFQSSGEHHAPTPR